MTVAALALLAVLAWLPFGAALAELFTDPGALWTTVSSARVLGLLGSTVALGLSTATFACVLGVPVGRLLARSSGRSARLVAWLLPLPLVLPPWMAGVAWTTWLPLRGFLGATFLLGICLWPLVALFASRGFRAAGRAADAAQLATGSRASACLRVELPLALPSILSGALLVFVFAVTDFAAVDYLSFFDPEPFVVLSSEIFQRWARLEDGGQAAAVSLAAIVPTLLALAAVLWAERRHEGRFAGVARTSGRPRTGGPAGALALLLVAGFILAPVAVLLSWGIAARDPLASLTAARDAALTSVGCALAAGAIIAVVGALVARLTLTIRGGGWLLGSAMLPLAAPGVMFAVGEVRLWNHPSNPLADAVYPSSVLLVLTLAGRYLPLGVLAARTLLLRLDEGPLAAARLSGRPRWRQLLSVHLPLMAPATGLALGLGYLLSMRELDMVVLVPAGSATLAHRIFAMVHIASDDVTAVLCLALLGLALVPAAAGRLLGLPGVACGSDDSLG